MVPLHPVWGWALRSVTPPWVAHRVCAMPVLPFSPESSFLSSISLIRPAPLRTLSLPLLIVTMPAESYPRYSTLRSPSSRMPETGSSATQPTIPHTVCVSRPGIISSAKRFSLPCMTGSAYLLRRALHDGAYHAKLFSSGRALGRAMREGLLLDPKSKERMTKRVLVSEKPDAFRPASGKVGQRILTLLAAGPRYPAEIARTLKTQHQTVYYHVGRLEKAGLITRVSSKSIRGGEANLFALSSDGYAVEFQV